MKFLSAFSFLFLSVLSFFLVLFFPNHFCTTNVDGYTDRLKRRRDNRKVVKQEESYRRGYQDLRPSFPRTVAVTLLTILTAFFLFVFVMATAPAIYHAFSILSDFIRG